MEHIQIVNKQDQPTMQCLLALWESAVRKTHSFLNASDIEDIKAEVISGLAGIQHLYCYEDGKIQGFIGVAGDKIEMLFVDAETRGKGIGKKLLNFAIESLDAMFVDVNEQNEQGVGFYRHMGFQQIGRSSLDEMGRPFPILHLEFIGKMESL